MLQQTEEKWRASVAFVLCFLLAATSPLPARAQDTSDVNGVRLALVAGVTLGTVIPVHLYQQHAWWQGQRAPFRFENDWAYALNVDKLGHMYAGYLLSRTFGYTLRWSGFSEHASTFYGSVLGLSYQMYVEVEDGFHKDYGFSPGDAFFNMIGATVPLAQSTFPVLQNFSLKYSYWPSSGYLNALQQGQQRVFLDDYQGTGVWLAMDPRFLMGPELSRLLPSWLGCAFGAAARDLDGSGGGRRILSLAIDYNLSKIETGSDLLHALFTVIDFFHLPAPVIRLDGTKIKAGIIYP